MDSNAPIVMLINCNSNDNMVNILNKVRNYIDDLLKNQDVNVLSQADSIIKTEK